MQLKHYYKGRFRNIRKQQRLFHHRTWLVMKLTIIIMLAACLQVSAKGFSQTITLMGKNIPLEKVFKEVKRQSGYLFVYRDEWLKQAKKVDVSITNGTVKQVLDYCFTDQPLTYSIVDKTVVVRLKEEEKKADSIPIIKLAGKVTDKSTGKPLEGASVYVKNSQIGTTTNDEGLFVLGVTRTGFILVVSFTGYKTIEMPFDGRTELNIELEPSTSELDNVVMIAYGQTTKRLNTGNVSTVTSEVIEKQPVTNVMTALEGRVPGLVVSQANGLPGAPVNVQIRGRNSIAALNNPLYVIDGVPYNSTPLELVAGPNQSNGVYGSPLNSINPSDIESIEVLKDAVATSIYGSRGANGVIMITTKKGKAGKATGSISVRSGISKVTRFAPLMNTTEYLAARRLAFALDGITPTVANAPDLLLWDTTKSTDWQKYFEGNTAHQTDVTASLAGGNDQVNYQLGGSYHRESSIFRSNGTYNRGSMHLGLNYRSKDNKLHINTQMLFVTDHNTINAGPQSLQYAAFLPPNYPLKDSLDNLYWGGNIIIHPLADMLNQYDSKTYNFNDNLSISYAISKGLNAKVNLGYNQTGINQSSLSPMEANNPAYGISASASFGKNEIQTYLIEPQISYDIVIGRGTLQTLIGANYQQSSSNGLYLYVYNYSSDLLLNSLADGTIISKSLPASRYKYASAFGRINYNWRNILILDGTYRQDASSRFGPGKQVGRFGAVGGAWIFSNEPFMKALADSWSYGKLRVSYGTSGNDGIGDYSYLATYKGATAYGSSTTLIPSRVANPDYGWEINKKFEAGLELGFFKDQLLFTASTYRNRSGNQLVGYPLPAITGFNSYQGNLPATVENKGWEIELSQSVFKNKRFSWSSNINLTFPKNKLISFPGIANSTYANTYVEGKSLNTLLGYQFSGIDPNTGLSIIKDINSDGKITSLSSYNAQGGDYVIIGKTDPSWYGGFNNTFRYKGFQLDIFLQYVRQQGINLNKFYYAGHIRNLWAFNGNYWESQENTNAAFPVPTTGYSDAYLSEVYFQNSSATVSDASFLRLKNIQLSYELNSSLEKRMKIKSCTLFLQAQNLLTFTKFDGYDPEENSNSVIPIPPLKTISLGLQCSF